MKVCIGLPTYKTVHSQTLASLLWLVQFSGRKHDLVFSVRDHHSIPHNRNKIVEEGIEADYILFIDSDMVFPEDLLERLLAHDKDIVGVDSSYKELPLQTTVKHNLEAMPKTLFQCRAVGGGILLVKTSVFKNRLRKPYFVMEHDRNGLISKGEDVYFCEEARLAGLEVWCDPSIKISHIGDYQY